MATSRPTSQHCCFGLSSYHICWGAAVNSNDSQENLGAEMEESCFSVTTDYRSQNKSPAVKSKACVWVWEDDGNQGDPKNQGRKTRSLQPSCEHFFFFRDIYRSLKRCLKDWNLAAHLTAMWSWKRERGRAWRSLRGQRVPQKEAGSAFPFEETPKGYALRLKNILKLTARNWIAG